MGTQLPNQREAFAAHLVGLQGLLSHPVEGAGYIATDIDRKSLVYINGWTLTREVSLGRREHETTSGHARNATMGLLLSKRKPAHNSLEIIIQQSL